MKTFILILLTAFILTSCSTKTPQSDEGITKQTEEVTEISIETKKDPIENVQEDEVVITNQVNDDSKTDKLREQLSRNTQTGIVSITPPNGIKLTDIENKLKSAEDISVILNLSCETSLYPGYKPGDNTSHMDYSIITKCYDLVRKYEKSYYINYITLNPKEKFQLPANFNKEYEEYKKTLWKYEDYLKQFKDTDTTASKDTCDTATAGADNTNCGPVSKEEFLKTMGKTMPYSEFEKMKQNEINSQRENMIKEQKRYKEILESME